MVRRLPETTRCLKQASTYVLQPAPQATVAREPPSGRRQSRR